MKYILDANGQPVLEPNIVKFCAWYDNVENRRVAYDLVEPDVVVSTVFLSMDHDFSGKGPPVLWETMIFGGEHDDYQERYTSRADAEAGHARAVRLVRGETGVESRRTEER